MRAAALFNKIGKTSIPRIGSRIFPDRMTVVKQNYTPGSGGGRTKTAPTNVHTSIPCTYHANSGEQVLIGDKPDRKEEYSVSFPSHTPAGVRINIDPQEHRLVVAARGNEPQKTFRMTAPLKDKAGMMFEATCELEA